MSLHWARAAASLGLSLWLGGGLGVMLSTRAAFRHAGGTPLAGQIAADALSNLSKLIWVSIILVAASAALGLRGPPLLAALCALLAFLAGELGVKPALRKLRTQAGGSIENLQKTDPQRKRFGMLHGVSMLLLLVQLVCATVALVAVAL